jgi:hypothetical protein
MAAKNETVKVDIVKMPKQSGCCGESPIKEEERPVTAEFNFKEKGKVQPTGYKGLAIDTKVTITIEGTVKAIGSRWNSKKDPEFTIEISSCDIKAAEEKPVSLTDAIGEADKSRKKVK